MGVRGDEFPRVWGVLNEVSAEGSLLPPSGSAE